MFLLFFQYFFIRTCFLLPSCSSIHIFPPFSLSSILCFLWPAKVSSFPEYGGSAMKKNRGRMFSEKDIWPKKNRVLRRTRMSCDCSRCRWTHLNHTEVTWEIQIKLLTGNTPHCPTSEANVGPVVTLISSALWLIWKLQESDLPISMSQHTSWLEVKSKNKQ